MLQVTLYVTIILASRTKLKESSFMGTRQRAQSCAGRHHAAPRLAQTAPHRCGGNPSFLQRIREFSYFRLEVRLPSLTQDSTTWLVLRFSHKTRRFVPEEEFLEDLPIRMSSMVVA